jgi:hypothetical protein
MAPTDRKYIENKGFLTIWVISASPMPDNFWGAVCTTSPKFSGIGDAEITQKWSKIPHFLCIFGLWEPYSVILY